MTAEEARETRVTSGVSVCARCGELWEFRIYPWWKDQPDWKHCAACAALRWHEEQVQAWRERRLVRKW